LVSKLLEACTTDDLLSDCGDVHSVDRLGAIAEAEYTALLAAEPVAVEVSCSWCIAVGNSRKHSGVLRENLAKRKSTS